MKDEAVITSFVERLQEQLQAFLPEGLPEESINAVLEQARSALRQGFAEFELVPRHELDGHLQALQQLTQTVKDLERRIAELESGR
jgi:BMFP domain-containing protein YqiC